MIDQTHVPVLLAEVLTYLKPTPGKHYVDGTVGGGGHARALLAASQPTGRVLGLDRDPRAIATLQPLVAASGGRLRLRTTSYDDLPLVLKRLGWKRVEGIILDLGLSSIQLDDPERGFGFRHDGPLDLRFDPRAGLTAAAWLAQASEVELADTIHFSGGLYNSRGLARKIREFAHHQPIRTTADLRRASGLTQPRHLAQLFQAIRIAVNDELGILQRGLPVLWESLSPTGRLAVISFHSGEDRIVKTMFRQLAQSGQGRILTKRPVTASGIERQSNPRARSAKLRVIEKDMRA